MFRSLREFGRRAGRGARSLISSRDVLHGSIVGTLGFVATAALEFLALFIVARTYGAAVTGALFASVALLMIARLVCQLGLTVGLVRSIAQARAVGHPGDVNVVFWAGTIPSTLFSAAVGVIGCVFAAPLSAWITGGDQAETFLRVLAVTLPLANLLQLLTAATRGMGTMGPTTVLERVAWPTGRLTILGIVPLLGLPTGWLAIAWLAPLPPILAFGWLWWRELVATHRRTGTHTPPTPPKALVKGLWTFSGARAIATMFQATTARIDVPLVAALAGPAEAGVYATVTRIGLVGTIPSQGIGQAVEPAVGHAFAANHRDRVLGVYRKATIWGLTIGLPIYLSLIYAPSVFLALFGSEFEQGATALRLYVMGSAVALLLGPIGRVLLMDGRGALNAANCAILLAINLSLNLWWIPEFGMEGAALAWAVTATLAGALPMLQMYILRGLHPIDSRYRYTVGSGVLLLGVAGAVPFVVGLPPGAALASYWVTCIPLFILANRHQPRQRARQAAAQ